MGSDARHEYFRISSYYRSVYGFSGLLGLFGLAVFISAGQVSTYSSFYIFISEAFIFASIFSSAFFYFYKLSVSHAMSRIFKNNIDSLTSVQMELLTTARSSYTSLLKEELEHLFVPIQQELLATAWTHYRWDCMIEAPPDDDIHKEWLIQHVRISHNTHINSDRIAILGAVSPTDGALEPYTKRLDFIFRWRMQGDPTKLDVNDPKVFHVNSVKINGISLYEAKNEIVEVPGGWAKIQYYEIPKEIHGMDVNLYFDVTVRKISGQDKRIPVFTELRNIATDAEFSLTVDSSIAASNVESNIGGIHPLNPRHRDKQFAHLSRGGNGSIQAKIVARHAINTGSSPKFEVVRK